MRSIWLLFGLCACGGISRPAVFPEYQPKVASETWCRLDSGVFAFEPRPPVAPSLLGHGCAPPRRDPEPEEAPAGSTFAELVVEPGGAIEVPVELPKALQGAGCQLDSVLIPHGKRISDLALEIASAGRVVPIVSYAQLPPPPEEGASSRIVVSDGAGRRRGIWAPDAASDQSSTEGSVTAIADPELWPTGAVLKFDGGRTADGAASVVFEIEKPDPAADESAKPEEPGTTTLPGASSPTTPPSPSGPSPSPPPFGPSPAPAPFGPSPSPAPFGPSLAPSGPSPSPSPSGPSPAPSGSSPSPSGPWPLPAPSPAASGQAEPASSEEDADSASASSTQPGLLVLIAYRHRIDIAAPDSFSIVLRARERAFGIGVRSDRESGAPRLSYRAPGAAGSKPTPTHLVPHVGIVVSRCGRPVEDVMRDIE